MAKWVDLHTHSTFSDGSLTPTELVAAAGKAGLAALALTDHDTCGGLDEFMEAAGRANLPTVPGVEISLEFRSHTMHMLGYGIDPEHDRLRETLRRIVEGRNDRNERIIQKLRMLGVRITLEEVEAVAGEKVVGRPHFAQVLIKKGAVRNFDEAFERFLGRGAPAYCERFRLDPEPAIELIIEAGGVAVLAHPYYLGLNSGAALVPVIERLKQAGLRGIEAYYTEHSEAQTALYLEMAERFDLLVTGGSDFHGSIKPDIALGRGRGSLRVPYALYESLCDALNQKSARSR